MGRKCCFHSQHATLHVPVLRYTVRTCTYAYNAGDTNSYAYVPTIPDFPVYYRKTVRIPEFYKIYRLSSRPSLAPGPVAAEFPAGAVARPAQLIKSGPTHCPWSRVYAVRDPFHSDPLESYKRRWRYKYDASELDFAGPGVFINM